MSFLFRAGLFSFLDGLSAGSTVYGLAFTQIRHKNLEALVLLTSNSGIEGGTIHALRIEIETDEQEEPLAIAVEAHDKLVEILKLRGLKWELGLLLTPGLTDALESFGSTGPFSLKIVEEWLKNEKAKQNKKAAPAEAKKERK